MGSSACVSSPSAASAVDNRGTYGEDARGAKQQSARPVSTLDPVINPPRSPPPGTLLGVAAVAPTRVRAMAAIRKAPPTGCLGAFSALRVSVVRKDLVAS